jgi:hypothetical protein
LKEEKGINKNMKNFKLPLIILGFIVISMASCRPSPSAAKTATWVDPTPSATIEPSITPTPEPTITPTAIPPTAVPLPTIPPDLDRLADLTVCASGCSYQTIQAAIDNISEDDSPLIEILDPVHTEAGIKVNKDLTIRGLGIEETVVQAYETREGAPDRVFLIERGVTAVISDLTIRHGDPANIDEKGGGIRNFGSLTLVSTLVTANQANGGGGINNAGDLTLINSTVSDNLADGIASPGLDCGNGGGIQSGSGTLFILNSTISGNENVKGRARGGGIHIGCSCQAVIVNSTISGNRAASKGGGDYGHGHSHGGGIYVWGELLLVNSTITDNFASGDGGGILVGKRLDYINTIIAGNTGKRGNCVLIADDQIDRDQLIGTNLYNLVPGGGCGAAFTEDPLLGPLENNGGMTKTHALPADSPAVDLIPQEFCLVTFDQRGELRADGEPTHCDPGAYEWQP